VLVTAAAYQHPVFRLHQHIELGEIKLATVVILVQVDELAVT
jgi:hypothetical protein